MRTLVICSGGLDSVSLAHIIAARGELAGLVSFDYGQRHRKELDFAAACAHRLGVSHRVIDMRGIGAALSGSALTDDIDVPDGHYAEDTMKITVVPNRNAIMLTIAYGIAAATGAGAVATAAGMGRPAPPASTVTAARPVTVTPAVQPWGLSTLSVDDGNLTCGVIGVAGTTQPLARFGYHDFKYRLGSPR